MRTVVAFLKDESAATAIEYALIASGVALAIVTVIKGLGTNVKNTFSTVSSAVK
jgi:pilus assembly protein Flp/PilA